MNFVENLIQFQRFLEYRFVKYKILNVNDQIFKIISYILNFVNEILINKNLQIYYLFFKNKLSICCKKQTKTKQVF